MSTEELFCDGYTVIEKLIDDETCDNLKEYLDKKYHEYKRNGELPYNYLKGHDQIHLPRNVEDLPLNYIFNKKNTFNNRESLCEKLLYVFLHV